jgi:hypothetical protein
LKGGCGVLDEINEDLELTVGIGRISFEIYCYSRNLK